MSASFGPNGYHRAISQKLKRLVHIVQCDNFKCTHSFHNTTLTHDTIDSTF
jgi:hypothetical protein